MAGCAISKRPEGGLGHSLPLRRIRGEQQRTKFWADSKITEANLLMITKQGFRFIRKLQWQSYAWNSFMCNARSRAGRRSVAVRFHECAPSHNQSDICQYGAERDKSRGVIGQGGQLYQSSQVGPI
jgi:hypothetical protein